MKRDEKKTTREQARADGSDRPRRSYSGSRKYLKKLFLYILHEKCFISLVL